MKIILNLNRYCIETASKKRQDRLVSKYFKTNGEDQKKAIECQIGALRYFLENADFSDLRYHCSRLGADKEVSLIVPRQFKNIHVRFNDTIVYPKWTFCS